ncbi:MAG: phosphate ABC transporter permease PstA [bacterium]
MTDSATGSAKKSTIEVVRAGLARRKAAERRFRLYGIASIGVGILLLMILFTSVVSNGYTAFMATYIKLDVELSQEMLGVSASPTEDELLQADFQGAIKSSLRGMFPEVKKRRDKRTLYSVVSSGAEYQLRDLVIADSGLLNTTATVWVLADDEIDGLVKGHVDITLPEDDRKVKDITVGWVEKLSEQGRVEKRFNVTFFTSGDSRDAEQAGIWGAVKGSFYVLLVTLLLSFPIGVAAAIYLEEFAPQNRITDLIEVNINNLAAVPSIVFGLLGLAVFINFFGMPRSAPIVGGVVLTLMTLPTIIISSRAALKSVPPSIKEAALGVGASHMQAIFYHVLPLAMPGMLTGAIIGMAQALGESAPLLMIGMVAFVADIPQGAFEPSTVLPVQVYLWADSPERAFVEKTSAAIMVLLTFLIAMNALAIFLRKRFERRW